MPLYQNNNSVLVVQDQKTSGSNGGTSTTGVNTRALNFIQYNTINGSGVSANQVTLPAGVYIVTACAPAFQANNHRVYLYNTTDLTYDILGDSTYTSGTAVSGISSLKGTISISGTKIFELRHYISNGVAINGLGVAATSGQNEVYAQAEFIKIG